MTSPNVFVTAVHQIPKRAQDAMAVWVEELRVDNFKICLLEAKIFDGPHKNIKIVSEKSISFCHWIIRNTPKSTGSFSLSQITNLSEKENRRKLFLNSSPLE